MANGIFTLKQQQSLNADGTWTLPAKTPSVDYLVVAGGGSGGYADGGGGGAGGLLQGTTLVTAGSSITVTVGAGGTVTPYGAAGNNGADSVFGSITSTGGGGGAGYTNVSKSGGSGGGGSASYNSNNQVPGKTSAGQGNNGGYGQESPINACGGGGGAGTVGSNAIFGNIGGTGGAGIASTISGTTTVYAGGGAGGGATYAGTGGVGGGGNGGYGGAGVSTGGTANTGGGGGGDWNGVSTAGSGGSGIVIISYPDIYPAATTTTGSPTVSTSGSGSVSFNGSSDIAWSGTSLSGNYTIECWFYQTSKSTSYVPIISGTTGSYNFPLAIDYNGGGKSDGYIGAYSVGGIGIASSSAVFSMNIWNHVAAVRSGSTVKIYLNGTQVATGTETSTVFVNTVGGYSVFANFNLIGYISNARVTNTAVYTSNFTPSTTPLTAISGTQLLLNTVSGAQFADSSTNSFVATVIGTPTWNQLSPFATGLGYKNRVYTWTGNGSVTF